MSLSMSLSDLERRDAKGHNNNNNNNNNTNICKAHNVSIRAEFEASNYSNVTACTPVPFALELPNWVW